MAFTARFQPPYHLQTALEPPIFFSDMGKSVKKIMFFN